MAKGIKVMAGEEPSTVNGGTMVYNLDECLVFVEDGDVVDVDQSVGAT